MTLSVLGLSDPKFVALVLKPVGATKGSLLSKEFRIIRYGISATAMS